MSLKPNKYNCYLKSISLFLIIVISLKLQSQSKGIKGNITNEMKVPLEMVSVALLNPKDSTFLSYTNTDEIGNFLLQDIPKDTVLIQLNLIGFKSFSKKIIYKNQLIDLKTIVLKEDVSVLDEIVISAVFV